MGDGDESGGSCESRSGGAGEPASAWVSLAAAARMLHRHPGGIKSLALAGGIRYRALPGARVVYNRADCERLAGAAAAGPPAAIDGRMTG